MTCEGKCSYSHARALEIKRRRERENKTPQLREYFCNKCGHWHLTSREDFFREPKQEAA